MSSVNRNNISVGDFDKVISDLQKGGGFSVGSEWVMRYIAENGAELSGRNLRFEVVEAIEDESRNLIRRIDVEEIIGKTKIFYEFKSVKDIPPVNFYEQFGKDLMLDDVTSLDQIKWIFDGRKVTQRQLTENITNAIKQWNVPDRVLRKWDAENKKSDFIQRLLDVVNTIFKSK